MKKGILNLLLCALTLSLSGQVEQVILPSDLKQQTIITEPATLRKGFFRAGITNNYSVGDRVFDESGKKSYLMGSNGWATNWLHEVNLYYGVIDRLQLAVQVPYVRQKIFYAAEIMVPGYDTSAVNYNKLTGNGFGDISFSSSLQLLTEDEKRPAMVLSLFATFPTGRKNPENIVSGREFDLPAGSGETTLNITMLVRKIFYPYSVTIYSSYLYHFRGKKIFAPGEEEVSFKSGDRLYLGGSYNAHLNDWIALMNEIALFKWWDDEYYGPTSRDQGISGRWGIMYQPSVVFQIRRFRFFEVTQIPLYGKNYMPADPQYTLGLQYTF